MGLDPFDWLWHSAPGGEIETGSLGTGLDSLYNAWGKVRTHRAAYYAWGCVLISPHALYILWFVVPHQSALSVHLYNLIQEVSGAHKT